MTTYLVTGGLGFIGSHIAEALLRRGDRVRVLDNYSTGRRENLRAADREVEIICGDITDAATLDTALRDVDTVFHQAALASVPRSLEAPLDTHNACATGTLLVLDGARRHGVRRVVYAASSSAYGNPVVAGSKKESDLPQPLSPYAAAKLAGEYYCKAFYESFGLETVCLRYFNVFGPKQDPNGAYAAVIPRFIDTMLAGGAPTIFGDGSQSRDFTYVDNVVHANLLAAQAESVGGRVFNVGSGYSTSLLDLVGLLNEALGTSVVPQHEPPRIGDVKDSLADISQTKAMLRFDPQIDLREGIQRTVAYFKTVHDAKK